ncbi:Uncharacterized protein FWK35_00003128, partial [Aphis craccivora]
MYEFANRMPEDRVPLTVVSRVFFAGPPCSGLPRASFGFFDDTLANVRCCGATIILYSVGGLSRGCYGRQQRGRRRNYI